METLFDALVLVGLFAVWLVAGGPRGHLMFGAKGGGGRLPRGPGGEAKRR